MSELTLAPKSRRPLNTDSLEIGDEMRQPKGLSEAQWDRMIVDDLKKPKEANWMPPRTKWMMRLYVDKKVSLAARWVYDVALSRLRIRKAEKPKARSRGKTKGGSLVSNKVYLPTNFMKAWGVKPRTLVRAKQELIEKGFLEEIVENNYWGAAKQYKLLILPWGLK